MTSLTCSPPQACQIYTGVEKIIVIGMDDIPEDCVSFLNMMIYDDGTLYDKVRLPLASLKLPSGAYLFILFVVVIACSNSL